VSAPFFARRDREPDSFGHSTTKGEHDMATAHALLHHDFFPPAGAQASLKSDPSGLRLIARLLSSRLDALEKRLPIEGLPWKKAETLNVAPPGAPKS
jgi:hypothetical protein